MTTKQINTTRSRLRNRKRLVAIGRGVAGSGFVITTGGAATAQAPADFAEAVAEVDGKPVQAWPVAVHEAIENEHVGAAISAQPWLY